MPNDKDGYLFPTDSSSKYVDQQQVFRDQGVEMLENAFAGFNTCIFAYGQTGSGKSYSIRGYGENKGVVPLMCEELFRRVEKEKKKGEAEGKRREYKVIFSMVEIYNEIIQDLQVKDNDRIKGGL